MARRLVNTYKKGNRVLKIYESANKMRGEVYDYKTGILETGADFKGKDRSEYRVLEYYGFSYSDEWDGRRWYRADFQVEIDGETHNPDSEYYMAADKRDAIKIGRRYAREGVSYADVNDGKPLKMELTYVAEVDYDSEFLTEIETVYY